MLKTLKDIDVTETKDFGKSELREEAIKWIKQIRENTNHESSYPEEFNISGLKLDCWAENMEDYGANSFIEHFFNITEEDLK